MYVIIMNNYKKLTTSKKVDLYEGDNLADKIRFLFPQTYNNIDLSECIVSLNYTDLSGEECSYILEKDEELYKKRLSYHLPINNKITEFYGEIVYYISFSLKDNTENILFHTEDHTIEILPRKDSIPPGEIIPPDSAGKILKEVYELKEGIKNLEVKDVVKYVEQTLTEEEKAQARKNIDAISINEIPEVEIPDTVQSDWSQNDENVEDYIKNRTHYTYKKQIPDEVIFDADVIYDTYHGLGMYKFPSSLQITNGTKCLVQFNNVSVIVTFGQENILNNDDENKIGSSISLNSNAISVMYYSSETGIGLDNSHLKICTVKDVEVVVPLDEKYIPDNIPKVQSASVGQILEVEEVDENGKPIKWKATDLPEISGESGKDGFSPIATVEQTDDGVKITLEDKNGITTASVNHGKDGKNGTDGKDGYTPQKGIDYFDGEKGDKGDKGDKGEQGIQGEKGADGYTPQKNVDYFDGKDGKDGQNGLNGSDGKDGYTPVKGVDYFDGEDGKDGTSVTVKNVSESTADGGSNVVTFSDGKKITIKNGSKGSKGEDGYTPIKGVDYFDGEKGADGKDGYTPQKGIDYFDGKDGANGKDGSDGYTPVKGTDYFTEADKAELVTDVLNALPTWQGGAY